LLEALRLIIALVLGITLPLAVQVWDRRRLTKEQRSGAWNTASWGSALYAFGPLSMIGWCWVTRQEWARWRLESTFRLLWKSAALLLIGLLAACSIWAAIVGVDQLIGLVAGA
jgi:hypothetical protein